MDSKTPGLRGSQESAGNGDKTSKHGTAHSNMTTASGQADGRSQSASEAQGFATSIISLATQGVLDQAGAILTAVAAQRNQLPTDLAAVVGCLLVYYMDVDDTLKFVCSLDEPRSGQFLVALAQRVRSNVMRSDVAQGKAMLPSPAFTRTTQQDRTRQLSLDMEHSANDVAMGGVQPNIAFKSASEALAAAVQRFTFINTLAGATGYGPYSIASPMPSGVPSLGTSSLAGTSKGASALVSDAQTALQTTSQIIGPASLVPQDAHQSSSMIAPAGRAAHAMASSAQAESTFGTSSLTGSAGAVSAQESDTTNLNSKASTGLEGTTSDGLDKYITDALSHLPEEEMAGAQSIMATELRQLHAALCETGMEHSFYIWIREALRLNHSGE